MRTTCIHINNWKMFGNGRKDDARYEELIVKT